MISDFRSEFFVHEGKFIHLLCLSVLKDYEFVRYTSKLVWLQLYNRSSVFIIKWGKLIFRFVLLTLALALGLQVIIMTEGNLFIVAVVLVSFSEKILKHISICSYFMPLRGNVIAANLADLKFRLTKLLSFRRIKWIWIVIHGYHSS